MKMYGIANCDSVKKAKMYLDDKKIAFEFVDFKKCPPTESLIKSIRQSLGEWPVNRRGPTFRKIKDQFEKANDKDRVNLLIEFSSAIKRPILVKGNDVLAMGFDQVQEKF